MNVIALLHYIKVQTMNAYYHLNQLVFFFNLFCGCMKSVHIRYFFDHLKPNFGHIFSLKRVPILSFLTINADEENTFRVWACQFYKYLLKASNWAKNV